MGLFDKLFSKKEKEPVAPKEDEIIIEKPYGRFKYFGNAEIDKVLEQLETLLPGGEQNG